MTFVELPEVGAEIDAMGEAGVVESVKAVSPIYSPIGGKIVFQRWHDSKANRDLMKIEYVYQSAEQLRNADALTLQAPAQRVTLELSGCPIDADGFCPMDKFDSVLNEAVK